uniref:Uncharacterized protein n=1 Tax=Arundo donax TaxID=35708 RepID=A0A0A9CAC7_ARUDO
METGVAILGASTLQNLPLAGNLETVLDADWLAR